METTKVNSLCLNENLQVEKNESDTKNSNIGEITEDKKKQNDDDTDLDNKNPDPCHSEINLTEECNDSRDDSISGASESEGATGSDDAHTKHNNVNVDEEQLTFFSNNGPVFPARQNRDLHLTMTHPGIDMSALTNVEDVHDVQANITMKKAILSYIDKVENKNSSVSVRSLKRSSSGLSPGKESNTNFLPKSSNIINHTNNNEILNKVMASSTDTEAESLPPLSASFFNCQFQTPSWIDDPLIGVPASAMENKNTHRKTGADMRILTAYMRSLNEMRLPEAIPPNELDKYLSSFFLVVRKADGSEYEPCSLRAMLASIERYLRFKNYPLSLTRDSAFSNMRNVLKLKQQTLRSIGKGQKTPSEVSPSSLAREGKIAHLFKSQEMGPYTPSSVVFTLCFYFCMYLRLRKSTENKKLLWGDIVLCKDDNGREFLTFSSQMLRRTQSSSKLNLKPRIFRVWADPSCPEKDPVTIYKFYAQKRPTSMNTNFAPFYLGINVLFPTQGQLWYRPAAMGINKLNEMVRQIRDITGVRSTSDFHGDLFKAEKQTSDLDMSSIDDQSPSNDLTERQESECDVKMEAVEDGDEDDGNSNLAIDFSQEQHDPPIDCSHQNGIATSSAQHIGMAAFRVGAHTTTYSDEENSNDSSSRNSFSNNLNGDSGHDLRNGQAHNREIDLTKGSSPDFPLNCSTKGRMAYDSAGTEGFNQIFHPGGVSDALSVNEAKQQLIDMVKKMDFAGIMEFDQWLKRVKFSTDPLTGDVVCKEEELMNVKAISNTCSNGANITLNISLTPQAMQGDGPITVTALTSIPSDQQQNSSSSKPNTHLSTSIKNSSTFPLVGLPHGFVSPSTGQLSPDKPLDLVTSPVSRNTKSSLSFQAKSNQSHGSNGVFPSMTSTSGMSHLNPSLAKRLRLSAEQAEAYTSASIMASLSSANLMSERLRLQLMQAGLRMGDYGLDAHTAGLMDMTSTEALRSQLLHHYGIKSEPK